jgi:N-dimethylarginine dimethylaminohydrolase
MILIENKNLRERSGIMDNGSLPEWTEERAIAALEENKQVMIAGLREQARGQKVYVAHEFAKLKGVIIGNPESMYLPDPFHPSWYTSFRSLPREKLDWMASNRGKHVRDVDRKLWESMAKGLEALAETYRQAGAHVIQNTQTPPPEVINYTAGWLGKYGKHWAFHAQAFGEVFGNVIVNFHETQPSIRYNCVEYVEAFMGLVESDPDAVWMAMPDPLPLPTAFGAALSPGDIRIFPEKLVVVAHGVFDKAHITDLSKPRSSGNELGAEVLRRMLKPFGWRVEQIYFDANYGYHIDTLMPVIREGLIAVNENVLLTELPEQIRDWERINIDPDEYVIGAGNSVPLSADAQAITAGAKKYIKEVEKRGVNAVPVPFDDVYHSTGSGMHCATFSYWREDV